MPPARSKAAAPSDKKQSAGQRLVLIHGDDDYLVAEEGRRTVAALTPPGNPEFGVETVDGLAVNQAEAETCFRRLFEALQTSSFFATEKVVWWRDTNLLGTDQTADSATVRDSVGSLANMLKGGLPPGVSFVITASNVDARKSIVKVIGQTGEVVAFKKDPYKARENEASAIRLAQETAERMDKEIDEGAALLLVEMTAGDSRTIVSEIEKLAAYTGDQKTISEEDVRAIASRRPGGIVWDLADALADRNLARILRVLDDLLFMGEEPVGLFFTLVTRVRLLLFLSILAERKLFKPGGDYNSFKSQLERLPAWVKENLPEDRKFNPLAGHPFALWKASVGVTRYTRSELQRAVVRLLECNERMFSGIGTPLDHFKEALVQICVKSPASKAA
jgi:DNA polymerase-3 subunit delta